MKFHGAQEHVKEKGSRPARGAWIEMLCILASIAAIAVAPREGRVD